MTEPTVEETIEDRDGKYGDVEAQAAVYVGLKAVIASMVGPVSPVHQQSLDMICLKLSRITCGDPANPDNWHDIGGYAKLAEDSCPLEVSE